MKYKYLTVAVLFILVAASAPAADGSDAPVDIAGAPAVVRLFCAPCYDRYAHQMMVRTLSWGVPRPDGLTAVGTLWNRSRAGSLRIQPPPDQYGELALILNGERFDPAQVYAFFDGKWRNVALHFGLPAESAMPALPSYIRIERAPFQEEPQHDDLLFSLY